MAAYHGIWSDAPQLAQLKMPIDHFHNVGDYIDNDTPGLSAIFLERLPRFRLNHCRRGAERRSPQDSADADVTQEPPEVDSYAYHKRSARLGGFARAHAPQLICVPERLTSGRCFLDGDLRRASAR
jgi:hypothetical protein